MVESSKILTVSYGTFSCTLEGFEDSFSTMKAIAEYFRDLAAEDRYFGAEPPTPDAEMLSRIAEREIARRVEAHTSDEGIHLRATPETDQPAMPPVATPPVALSVVQDTPDTDSFGDEGAIEIEDDDQAEDIAAIAENQDETPDGTDLVAEVDDAAEDVSEDDGFAAFTPIAEAPAHPDPDSVASKLQRIQAVVGQTDALADEDYAEDAAPAMMPEIADADAADEAEADDMTAGIAADVAEDESASDDTSFEVEADDASDEIDVADITEVAFEDDTVTADYAMEDVMSSDDGHDIEPEAETDEAPAQYENDVAEDATDADTIAEDEAEADDTDAQISQVLRNLERAGATVADDVEIAPMDDALEGPDAFVADGQIDDQDDVEALEDPVSEDELAEALEDFVDAAEQDSGDYEADAEAADLAQPFAAADDIAADLDDRSDETEAEPEVAEDPAPAKPTLRARILRVAKKVKPEPVEIEDLDGAEELEAFADADEGALSAADEADLQAELDAVIGTDDSAADDHGEEPEHDLMADAADDDHAEQPIEDDAVAARAGRASLPDNDDAAMSRIMEQADEELSDPESSRRRDAIAQLKAAVAATEAARQLGDDDDAAKTAEDAFREDLNEVVRPRRAPKPAKSAERSERPRPAPLKLVASQRVDMAESASEDVSPVRPRRVAMSEPAATTDASSFAEFAEEMGASELPDLLEAAAAYTAYVEGENEFSRPQIMRKVQASSDEPFTREDGLRSFGTLLRQGRISKAGNGRFQVSDQTRFKPEQKAG